MAVPLLEHLEEHHGPEAAGAEGAEVEIVADKSTPSERVSRTIFTAGRAGLGGYTFAVAGPDGEDVNEIEVTRPCLKESIDEEEGPSRVGDWRACYEKSEPDEEKPLNLTVAVGVDGVILGATGAILPAQGDCPEEVPTICLDDPSFDVEAKLERARELLGRDDRGERERAGALLREIEAAYDWRELHRQLRDIHRKFPGYREYVVGGESQIPFGLVVRAMDVARYRLEGEDFEDAEAFRQALMGRYVSPESEMALFPEVVWAL